MLDLIREFNQVAKYKIAYAKIKFSCILIITNEKLKEKPQAKMASLVLKPMMPILSPSYQF